MQKLIDNICSRHLAPPKLKNIAKIAKSCPENISSVSKFKFLSFVTIWVWSKLDFSVLSPFEFLSFVTIYVFEFCHQLSFWVLSQFEISSFVTIFFLQSKFLIFFTIWVSGFVTIWFFSKFDFFFSFGKIHYSHNCHNCHNCLNCHYCYYCRIGR